ncbi:MAG: hypothetical protein IKH34_06620 [Oscillospiraceae bacterium]|nr:hypothetical protein [Oscillospiraceae bacterium]
MKTESYVSLKSREELLSAISERGVQVREDSTEEELRFKAHRAMRSDFVRTSLSFLIVGSLRRQGTGTLIRFRIMPGLSTILTAALLLGMLIYSMVQTLVLHNPVNPWGSMVFLLMLAATLLAVILLYFLRKKKVRDDILRLL